MRREVSEQRPGASLVAQHLADMMLVQALRLHLSGRVNGGVGWLFALADEQMNAAICAMHDTPAYHWTLDALGSRVGMSRSIFALKFKKMVGAPPMEYLTRWRMMLAADKLTNSDDSTTAIALAVGYESESAFGKTFKRVMGCSPRQFSRGRDPGIQRNTVTNPQISAQSIVAKASRASGSPSGVKYDNPKPSKSKSKRGAGAASLTCAPLDSKGPYQRVKDSGSCLALRWIDRGRGARSGPFSSLR